MSSLHKLIFKGEELCDAIYSGERTYDIRIKDRDFIVGDVIQPISMERFDRRLNHPIDDKFYQITHVTASYPGALSNEYCIIGLREVDLADI